MSEANGHIEHTEGQHEHHIVSPKVYGLILLALLVGTALTVWASYVDLGEWHVAQGITIFWNPILAIAIACTKATLVVLFFMHVKYSTNLTKFTVFAGIFTFLVLVGMTMADYISRAWGQW
jgi:cytochrome c oxidase subunit 4